VVAAAGVALVVAFARTVWEQATFAEVYALNYALAAGVLLTALRGAREVGLARAAVLGALLGLMALNHYSFVALVPLVGLVLLRGGGAGGRAVTVPLMGAACCGLMLLGYAYLPLRARANPPLNWGD